jgi:beta-lactam-binding protein with PASTA domain
VTRVAVIVGALALATAWIGNATADNQPAPISVPDVRGMNLGIAAERIAHSGLCVRLVAVLGRNDDGRVHAQFPRPGARVSMKAPVRLTIALWPTFSSFFPASRSTSAHVSWASVGCPPTRAEVTRRR